MSKILEFRGTMFVCLESCYLAWSVERLKGSGLFRGFVSQSRAVARSVLYLNQLISNTFKLNVESR